MSSSTIMMSLILSGIMAYVIVSTFVMCERICKVILLISFFIIFSGPVYLIGLINHLYLIVLGVLSISYMLMRERIPIYEITSKEYTQSSVYKKYALNSIVVICTLMIFLSIAYQFYAFYLMGDNENSYWIFNVDNAFRMINIWQILKSDVYPPPSLSNLDISYHYHYGSAAIVSIFSNISGIEPTVVYYKVMMPILLLLSLLVIFIVVYTVTKKYSVAIFSTAISMLATIPLERVLERTMNLFHESLASIYSSNPYYILNGFAHNDAEKFGNGVFDISYLAFSVVLGLVLSIVLLTKGRDRSLILLTIAPLLFFLKSESVIILTLFIFTELILYVIKFNYKIMLVFAIPVIVALIAIFNFGSFEIPIRSSSIHDKKLGFDYIFLTFVSIAIIFYNTNGFKKMLGLSYDRSYVAVSSVLAIMFFSMNEFIQITMLQNGLQYADLTWEFWRTENIIILIILMTYFSHSSNTLTSR